METPIYDFLQDYQSRQGVRFHMPGHKGKHFLGCEDMDITDFAGADDLAKPTTIIAASERHASEIFGSQATLFSTEGSSQSIRAMVYLLACYALNTARKHPGQKPDRPYFIAGRNAHKAFMYALALVDGEVDWLWPPQSDSICSGRISAEDLERALKQAPRKPAAVYLTSPDYLGGRANIHELAEICHRYDTLLAVDNAHGAYQHFLAQPCHPLDIGADICCDSAHKTLPVLTGGGYLHLGKSLPAFFKDQAKPAMNLFGSTSPSYLILASLDLANRYMTGSYAQDLADWLGPVGKCKAQLRQQGWQVEDTEPLKITLRAPQGLSGLELAQILRSQQIVEEYADRDYVVLMVTPQNSQEDLDRLCAALGQCRWEPSNEHQSQVILGHLHEAPEKAMTIREAVFSAQENLDVSQALGRICASPTVSCPPAIPLAVSGERINPQTLELLQYYGIAKISVVTE